MRLAGALLTLVAQLAVAQADGGASDAGAVDAGWPEFRRALAQPLKRKADEARVARVFEALSPRERAAQLLLAYPQIGKATPVEVGGVVFVGNTLSNLSKARERIASTYARARVAPFVAVDMEGGGSNRLKRYPGLKALPSAQGLAALPDAEVRRWGARVGAAMRELGLNLNLAPVLDMADAGHLYDSQRVFGDEPEVVTQKATAYAQGLLAQGVVPIGKHFPGYGSVTGNSDHEVVVSDLSKADLERQMSPFVRAAKVLGGVMMSNVQYPAYATRPAILTEALVVEAHRLGLITVTDDIAIGVLAQSVGGTSVDVLEEAVRAGNDLLLTTAPPDWDKGIDPVGVLERLYERDLAARAKMNAACQRLLALKDRMGLLEGW